ncbi:polymer-forming cytoskeletal [bacterium BMS3Bbin12]|nr:polymer-forming cytoskeletal [bacterium BMS3Abin12]GBE48912.1 polymer-forming cytoskeletal [bacterium BMS3Bbin12]GBE49816.1 polymer-forming cytoskeletal [bacterium BMS3Bbin13]
MFEINPMKRNSGKDPKNEDRSDEPFPIDEPVSAAPRSTRGAGPAATIGPSIHLKGDLTGEEDLVIQGHVEGTINLKQNNLTVGGNGRIHANIFANTITVEGELQGDLYGTEKVIIRRTGNVRGNIVAPRVNLEDGAKFKGSIEMDPKAVESVVAQARPVPADSRPLENKPVSGPGAGKDKPGLKQA